MSDCLERVYEEFLVEINNPIYHFQTLYDVRDKYVSSREEVSPFDITIISPTAEDIEILRKSKLTFWDIVLFYFQKNDEEKLE